MPYIYRYIDLKKEEVCYVGKVTTYNDVLKPNGLTKRHAQHRSEEWYKNIGDEYILLQYIELNNHTDADILETWLIQYYDTGQLYNKAKTGWGRSQIDLSLVVAGQWRNFRQNGINNKREIEEQLDVIMEYLIKSTEGLTFNVDDALKNFNLRVKEIERDLKKARRISRVDAQGDFLRINQKKEEEND